MTCSWRWIATCRRRCGPNRKPPSTRRSPRWPERLPRCKSGCRERSLRAVAPGETDLEFSPGLDPARFGDAQLRELAAVGEDLALLDLRRTAVTDAGLAALANMPNLRRLQLQETSTGDAGLIGIKTLPNLEVLNLYDTHVTDQGVAALASLKKLKRLYVWRTAVTDAGEAALRKQLPKLEIVKAEPIPIRAPCRQPSPMVVAAAAPVPRAAAARRPAGRHRLPPRNHETPDHRCCRCPSSCSPGPGRVGAFVLYLVQARRAARPRPGRGRRGSRAACEDHLQRAHRPHPFGELLLLPRAGRDRAPGRPARGPSRVCLRAAQERPAAHRQGTSRSPAP